MTINEYEMQIYKSLYASEVDGNYKTIWEKLKNDKDVLNEAIKIVRDKNNLKSTVKGMLICDLILKNYDDVDENIYYELVNKIYHDCDIARIVIDGYLNGGNSYLLMTLWNNNLKLNDYQKEFVIKEAMNKVGTKKYNERLEERSKELERKGITDDRITTIELKGKINKIGAKSKMQYIDRVLYMLDSTQAHGSGVLDIRYFILKNNNWSEDEKKKLVYDFYFDDKTWNDFIKEIEIKNEIDFLEEMLKLRPIKDENDIKKLTLE